ncbi:MAG: DUF1707 domain-containing protein [Acidimicrobiales bacterium]
MSDLEPHEPTPPAPAPGPISQPVSDADRQAAVDRVQQALADDVISFEAIDDRFAAIYRAASRADLDAALAGLPPTTTPPPARSARHLSPASSISLIGDTKVGGWIAVGPSMTSVTMLGDAIIDLSSADIPPEGVELRLFSLIGDVKVLVPDGARVQVQGITLIGDTKQRLVPPMVDGPTIRISTFSLIGDVVVQSFSQLADRQLRRFWRNSRQTPQ